MKNLEYDEEVKKLNHTRKYIDKEVKESEERLERGFEDYDFDDYADDFMKAALKERFTQRVKNLKMVRSRPYFARVDFLEKGNISSDCFYFGKVFVTDYETLEQIVIDWRAPVANLYYEGKLGEAKYDCPGGIIEGDIRVKRQYFFDKEGNLENTMDIDVTTNDKMLQPYLSASSDTRLKSIIATIQTEQNKIIRADMWKPLVVQGVAGSGKTTIALHRIAYLIYNYDKNFFPEEFLIIAPNKFFLNYISNVLPDLGVDHVQQNTYEEIGFQVIGKTFEIEDPNRKLSFIINNKKNEKEKSFCDVIISASTLKSSIRYKNLIDEYIFEIEKRFLPDKDFIIDDYMLMKKQEIQRLFYREYVNLPLCRRIDEIKKHMVNSIRMRSGTILKEIDEDRQYKISKIRFEIEDEEKQREEIRKVYDEKEYLIKIVTKDVKKVVNDFFKGNKIQEPITYYKEFIEKYLSTLCNKKLSSAEVKYIKDNFRKLQRDGKIEMEDIAPLMYIKHMIHGINIKFDLKHIVIDEAQDFSEFQFYIFKKIVKSNSLTILGDLSQGIYYYRGTNNWQNTMNVVFEEENNAEYLTLSKTYRTTTNIMNIANKVISNIIDILGCPLGEPVIGGGEPVTIKKFDTEEHMENAVSGRIIELENKGFENIAVICKTIEDCEKLKEKIGRDDVHIITNKDSEYNGGINIVPSYLSKGLEFDAVIITNADIYNYTKSQIDTKLLYVCCTRAMSVLDIYHVDELTELLK